MMVQSNTIETEFAASSAWAVVSTDANPKKEGWDTIYKICCSHLNDSKRNTIEERECANDASSSRDLRDALLGNRRGRSRTRRLNVNATAKAAAARIPFSVSSGFLQSQEIRASESCPAGDSRSDSESMKIVDPILEATKSQKGKPTVFFQKRETREDKPRWRFAQSNERQDPERTPSRQEEEEEEALDSPAASWSKAQPRKVPTTSSCSGGLSREIDESISVSSLMKPSSSKEQLRCTDSDLSNDDRPSSGRRNKIASWDTMTQSRRLLRIKKHRRESRNEDNSDDRVADPQQPPNKNTGNKRLLGLRQRLLRPREQFADVYDA